MKAVAYVAKIVRGREAIHICLFHVLPPIPPRLLEFGGTEDPQKEQVLSVELKAAQGFMTAFPDLEVFMDDLVEKQGKILYHWTFEGTHGETGRRVRISGFESWRIGGDGLIAESFGNFDAADLERQIKGVNS